jgi:hypothetical protein
VKVYLVWRYIAVMIVFFLTSLAYPALSNVIRGYPFTRLKCVSLIQQLSVPVMFIIRLEMGWFFI